MAASSTVTTAKGDTSPPSSAFANCSPHRPPAPPQSADRSPAMAQSGHRLLPSEHRMEHEDHILIVDDDREIRQMVADYLRKNGLRASEAADGREMRAVLDTHAVDL